MLPIRSLECLSNGYLLPSPGGISSLQAIFSGLIYFISQLISRIDPPFILLTLLFFHLHDPKHLTSIKYLKEKRSGYIYLSILTVQSTLEYLVLYIEHQAKYFEDVLINISNVTKVRLFPDTVKLALK